VSTPVDVVEPTEDALSETVVMSADGAPTARGRDESLDGATMTVEHALGDGSAEPNREARPGAEEMGEDTVLMAPPGDAEATLYVQNELDETLRAFDAADETVLQAPATRTPIASLRALAPKLRALPPKLRALPPKWLAFGAGIFVAMILALFLVFSGEEPIPDAVAVTPVVESGTLRVTTEPDGALVFLDGERRGTTPFALEELPLGDYALRVERSGYLSEELSVTLTGELPLANFELVLVPAPAYLLVRSSPAGARVVVDGQRIGTTPTERYGVAPGSRVVRIVRNGYLPWEDTVSARSGETIDIDAMLTRDGRAKRPATSAKTAKTATAATAAKTITTSAPTSAPVAAMLVAHGDPGVVDPKCIECPVAPYPEAVRRRGLEGLVELSYVIDETGAVRDITVQESGGEIFDDSVTRAVQEWRYQPATKDGAPVRMRWVQRFRFRRGR
jgi:TonB family protein